MKTSRGPSKYSSLKIDEKLRKASPEKKNRRITFGQPPSTQREAVGPSIPKCVPLDFEPEPVPRTPSLTLNGADLTLSLKSAKALGDWRAALSVISCALFGDHAYRPNEQHLRQFMSILRQENRLDVALRLLHDFDARMQKGVTKESSDTKKPKDAVKDAFDNKATKDLLYHILLRAHADEKQWEKAMHVLNTMIERNYTFPHTGTMNIILSAMDDGKHWERALGVLAHMTRAQQMQEGTLEATEQPAKGESLVSIYDNALPNTVSYATTITLLETAGKFDLAQKLMREIPKNDRGTIMRSYAAVIHMWSMKHHRSGKKHRRIL